MSASRSSSRRDNREEDHDPNLFAPLAAQTGGHFIGADSIDELVDALNKTLGCPLITKRKAPGVDFARVRSPESADP
jgi:hypothetical protein